MPTENQEEEITLLTRNVGFLSADLGREAKTAMASDNAKVQLDEPTMPDESVQRDLDEVKTAEGRSLPDDLVAKIIAKLPFPTMFQARLLSRFWCMQLSSLSSCSLSSCQPSESSSVFLNEMKTVSETWSSFCPLVLNNKERWLAGYDLEKDRWVKFSEVSFSPSCIVAAAGCLLCGLFFDSELGKDVRVRLMHVRIANVLTGSWKQIQLPPRDTYDDPFYVQMFSTTFDSYKLLVATTTFDQTSPSKIRIQFYDSSLSSWSRVQQFKPTVPTSRTEFVRRRSQVFFNNKLYVMHGCLATFESYEVRYDEIIYFQSYNLDDETTTQFPTPFSEIFRNKINWYQLLVCGSDIMVAISLNASLTPIERDLSDLDIDESELPENLIFQERLMIFKLNPESHQLSEVTRGPRYDLGGTTSVCVAQGTFIYFGDASAIPTPVYAAYSLTEDEWTWFQMPTTEFCESPDGYKDLKFLEYGFQPGMNPFLQV